MHVIVPTEANVDGQRAANRKKKLRDALVYFNIKTDNPVSEVVNDQFKQILNLLISKFIIPCRQTITNRLIPKNF